MPIASYLLLPWFSGSGTAIGVGRSNTVQLIKLYLPATITVASIVTAAPTSDSGKHWGVGLYNIGGTLVLDSGPMAMTGAANEILSASITPVEIVQDMYWLGVTTESSTATLCAASMTQQGTGIMNKGTAVLGTPTNNGSNGQLPSTTGAITGTTTPVSADAFCPFVKLQA